MTLSRQFERELAALGTASGTTLNVSEPPRRLRCEIAELNSLAASFHQLRVTTTELYDATVEQLEALSRRLSERLNYLMEPISPIETDREGCVIQLRSSPPQKGDDGRCYYELLVRRGGELSLVRYRKERTAPRERIVATVTREVLARLVTDFSAVLDEIP